MAASEPNAFQRFLAARGLELRKMPPTLALAPDRQIAMSFRYVVAHYLELCPDFFFIQIGAFDGSCNDPLHQYIKRHHWRGVLVEPQPDIFQRLKTNYAQEPQLMFEQAAIGAAEGERDLYTVNPDAPPGAVPALDKRRGMASFRLDVMKKQKRWLGELESTITPIRVRVITFASLLEKYQPPRLDLLQIDTEGHDFEIIRTIDFTRTRPSIIHYEHKHLTPKDRNQCLALLADNGYKLALERGDTVAYHQDFAGK